MIEIIRFQEGQESLLCRIHNAAFRYWIDIFGTSYGYVQIKAEDIKYWLKPSSPNLESREEIWIANINQKPVGYACCLLEDLPDGASQLLFVGTMEGLGQSKIAVLPEYQRQGIAKRLVGTLINHYSHSGLKSGRVKKVFLIAYNDNEAATGFARALGFQKDPFFAVLGEFDLTQPIPSLKLPSPSGLIIREFRIQDLTDVTEIFQECRPDLKETFHTFEQVKDFYTQEEKWAEFSLVAEISGKVVGLMEFTKEGLIGIAGVLPSYQNQGIGSTFFQNLLETMRGRGKKKAIVGSGCTHPEAIRMYERFGSDNSRKQLEWIKEVRPKKPVKDKTSRDWMGFAEDQFK